MQKSQANVLNRGTEDELVCTGYRRSIVKTILCVLLSVITVGGLQLVFYWKPEWRLWCTSSKCVLKRATKVLLQNQYKEVCVAEVKSRPLSEATINSLHINSTPTPMPHMAQECEPDPNQVSVFYSTSTENQKDTESSDVAVLVAGGDGANNGTHSHLWSYSSMDSDEEIDDTKALINIKKKESENIFRYFEHHKLCYYWNESCDSFLRLYALEENTQCASIYSYKGYDSDQKQQRQDIYGRNVIDVEVPSYLKLFVKEVLNPFYIFQIFSIILWIMENYFVYGGCILVIIIISLGVSLYETKRQSIVLHDMVAHESTVTVCRNGTEEEINSGDVVPGDLIYIPPHGCIMSCDAALISGNCIVNESMLTGESVPVTKTPLPCPPPTEGEPPQYYSPENHKRHTLFCGTKVIQTRYYGSEKVKAVVIRTGQEEMYMYIEERFEGFKRGGLTDMSGRLFQRVGALNAKIDSNLGDWQFLYVDLVITTTVAVLMGRNEAYPKLVKQRPAGSITNPTILISILSEILVVAVECNCYLVYEYLLLLFLLILSLQIDSNLGDWQFLYVDLVITTTVAVLMGRNEAYPKLVKQRPAGSITNPTILISIVSEILVVAVVQTTGYFLLFTQPWFTPLTPSHNPDDNILCYENSVIFLISSFQYITLAAAFSKGAPYRLPIYTNFLFLIALIVLVSTTVVMLFLPVQWSVFTNFLQLKQIAPVSLKFALIIGALVLFNILFAFIMESCVVDLPALKRAIRPLRCKKKPKNRYKLVEADLNKDPAWPPVGHTTTTNSKIFNGSINYA
nr:polyamine-transporting ATPase 13A3-like [Lytechinus pictus]